MSTCYVLGDNLHRSFVCLTSCEETLAAFDLDTFLRPYVEQTALENRNSLYSRKEGKFDGGHYGQEDESLWGKGLLSNPGSSLRVLSYNATPVCADGTSLWLCQPVIIDVWRTVKKMTILWLLLWNV